MVTPKVRFCVTLDINALATIMVILVATGIAISTVWMRQRAAPRAGPAAGGRGEPVTYQHGGTTPDRCRRLGDQGRAGGYRGRRLLGAHPVPTPRPATPEAVIAVLQGLVAKAWSAAAASAWRPERDQERLALHRGQHRQRLIGTRPSSAGARHRRAGGVSMMPMRQDWPRCAGAPAVAQRHRHHGDLKRIAPLFTGGRLFPNTELGHIEVRGMDAEKRFGAGGT
jgi:hypothetical protein